MKTLTTRLLTIATLTALCAGCGGTKGTPPELIDGDPRAVTAKRISQVLADHRAKVEGDIGQINKTVQAARGDKQFADVNVVQALQAEAANAVAACNQLNERLLELDRELRHAGNAYAAAAQAFRDRAEDYPDSSLKRTCLEWAAHYAELARVIPYERERIAEFQKALPATLSLCRQTKRLLDDYSLFLTTYHDATVPTAEVERYQAALKEYVQRFSSFERATAAYRGKRHD